MSSETRNCQNCKQSFTIEPEDFAFYEKMNVPPPTFCPDCRMQRRMAFRNERTLYVRSCDLCQKDSVGIYQKNVPFPVYCLDCWWSDAWDVSIYSFDVDFSKPFLKQLHELQNLVPRQNSNNASSSRMINSVYTNCAGDLKNCYLVFGALRDEDSCYLHYANDCKNCVDLLYAMQSEQCYDCFDIEQCYNLQYSQSCQQCHDSYFLFDCRNCSDCIGCAGLRNKQYCLFNEQYTKDEFEKKKAELRLGTRDGMQSCRERFVNDIYYRSPRKYYHGAANTNSSGDYVSRLESCKNVFYTKESKNLKFVFWCTHAHDTYDYFSWGDVEMCYEILSGGYAMFQCKFCHSAWEHDMNIEYSSLCINTSDLFGCVGLRKKQYCILNKQYSESEYYELRKKVIEHMTALPYTDVRGFAYPYGEFFPIEVSPFPYNDSVAQEFFPLTAKLARERGYGWQEEEKRTPIATLQPDMVPQDIGSVQDSIIKELIACEHGGACADRCTKVYKIIAQELSFYKQKNIPPPTLCPNCRHSERVRMRNPLKLWERQCMCEQSTHDHGSRAEALAKAGSRCPRNFQTAYAPERPEIIYCEECYQSEVV